MKLQCEFLAAWARARVAGDRGANLVEYAMLVALIAMVCIAAVSYFGGETDSRFSHTGSSIN
jgi:pilus assembly protein Flp/PilA